MIDVSILTNIAQGLTLFVAIEVCLLVESVSALAPPTLTTVLLPSAVLLSVYRSDSVQY
jgi:hypothetical protein